MSDKILSLRPDRDALMEQLGRYLAATRAPDQVLALLIVQIKRGPEFGTLFGFRKLEELMQQVAVRLDLVCRNSDRILRSGEYEYALILPELMNEGHAVLAANKIQRSLSAPLTTADQIVSIGACIGIAVCPGHADQPEALLHCAQLARADAEYREQPYSLYTPAAPAELAGQWDIESELNLALERGELEAFFQAKVNLKTGHPAGAEALVRWRSPKRGLVPPDKFIPVAMRSGQIGALTWSMLNMSLEHASHWPLRFGALPVSVNVAPSLLEDPALVARVTDAMNVWGITPERLILEVTESAVMRNPQLSFDTIRQLRSAGVLVSIDDFGTGYSSLANFRNMPASELKIDKSFVMGMLENQGDADIVRTILDLARTFHLPVVAEGVETLEIFKALAGLGCDYAQGYFISKPLPAADFTKFINAYTPPAS